MNYTDEEIKNILKFLNLSILIKNNQLNQTELHVIIVKNQILLLNQVIIIVQIVVMV